jgi:2-aminoethylphosphonate-pyruvate transaminase
VDKLLFTPGPLTTSASVKAAMLRDVGSRDAEFIAAVGEIRTALLELAGASIGYECVLMQGSGTFALESVISSAIPRDGRLLVLVNGAYGRRIAQIARVHSIAVETQETPENRRITPDLLPPLSGFTHVAVVHCETTTGILNPVAEIGPAVARSGACFIVDAMSSFGAIPIHPAAASIDFLISSSNKCIEGVPGFAFVLARRARIEECAGRARTLSLDLHAQWCGFERDGQFRFTPPTHALLAFRQALHELEAEGGIAGRAARYRRNHDVLVNGMRELGFEAYLSAEDQSPIITTYRYPDANFRFDEFYSKLSDLGFVIYPGKLTQEPCFRIGTIGRITESDVSNLLEAIKTVMHKMGTDYSVPISHTLKHR